MPAVCHDLAGILLNRETWIMSESYHYFETDFILLALIS